MDHMSGGMLMRGGRKKSHVSGLSLYTEFVLEIDFGAADLKRELNREVEVVDEWEKLMELRDGIFEQTKNFVFVSVPIFNWVHKQEYEESFQIIDDVTAIMKYKT